MRRCARSIVTIAAMMNSTMTMSRTVKKPLPNWTDWTIAIGKRATMLAKISSDMPLPIPRCVISSPNHMMSAVPAISVMMMTR